ncbi:hypothetical protein LTR95_018654, partial [Oleoguttula sp. CCFEE 5521]
GCTVHPVQRLRGGGKEPKSMASAAWHPRYRTMRIAPGGMIHQHFSHNIEFSLWDETSKITFATTMLGRDQLVRVTGSKLPHDAMDEVAYSSLGLPYFQDHRDLKRQIRNTPALRGTYSALKGGVPIKSLGEMLDILEESRQIEVNSITGEAPGPNSREVQLTELDELKARLHATSFISENNRGVVKWSTSGESLTKKPKALPDFLYDTSGTDDTTSNPESKDEPHAGGAQTPRGSNNSAAATLLPVKRRTFRSQVRGLLKRVTKTDG